MSSAPQSQSVTVKQERHDEAEIRELADKIMEANKAKMAAVNARPNVIPGAHVAVTGTNILGYLTRKPAANQQPPQPAVDDKKDEDYGKFGWITLGKNHIPYIFRQGEKYCAVRMVEQKVLNKYLNYLHQDIYSCTSIRSYYINHNESKLLTEINFRHSDLGFGKDPFTVRDLVVRVKDAMEFYNFLDVCYNKLIQGTAGPKDRCGFIRINKESVVPYTVSKGEKYVPLFYFEGETDNLKLKADELEGWDLSYLKFCCKVQGIRNELFASETCAVISLNDIKSYFPTGTGFEDYWPSKVVDSQLLVASKGGGQNGLWTKQPPTPPPIITKPTSMQMRRSPAPAAQAASLPGLPQSLPTVNNGWAGIAQSSLPQLHNLNQANLIRQVSLGMQMANANSLPTQVPSSRTAPRAHQYYSQPMTLSSPIPPPLVRATVSQNTLGYPTYGKDDWASGTYTSPSLTPQSVSQPYMMGLPSLMPPPASAVPPSYAAAVQSRGVPSSVHQLNQHHQRQSQQVNHQSLHSAQGSRSQSRQQQQQQAQQQQQVQQQQQQQAHQANSPRSVSRSRQEHPQQHPPPLIPVNGNATPMMNNTPSRYATPSPTSAVASSEVIDLSSSPRSQNMSNGRQMGMDGLKKMVTLAEVPAGGPQSPYKMERALVEGTFIPAINMKPHVYTDLLVTLSDLTTSLFPKQTVATLKRLLDLLGVEIYKGNQLQMQVLKSAGKCDSLTDCVPLVQINEVLRFLPQLKYMSNSNREDPTHSKRQRTS